MYLKARGIIKVRGCAPNMCAEHVRRATSGLEQGSTVIRRSSDECFGPSNLQVDHLSPVLETQCSDLGSTLAEFRPVNICPTSAGEHALS
jgi:hypothetical protein